MSEYEGIRGKYEVFASYNGAILEISWASQKIKTMFHVFPYGGRARNFFKSQSLYRGAKRNLHKYVS